MYLRRGRLLICSHERKKNVNKNKLRVALSGKGTAPGFSLWEIYVFLKTFLHPHCARVAGGWRGTCNPLLPLILSPLCQEKTMPASLRHQRPKSSVHNISKLFSTQVCWILTWHFWGWQDLLYPSVCTMSHWPTTTYSLGKLGNL